MVASCAKVGGTSHCQPCATFGSETRQIEGLPVDDGSMKLYFESSCAVDECARVCPISVIEPLSRPRHTLAALPHSSPLYRPTFRGRTAASQADALPVTKGVICRPRPPNPSAFPSALNARIILSPAMSSAVNSGAYPSIACTRIFLPSALATLRTSEIAGPVADTSRGQSG